MGRWKPEVVVAVEPPGLELRTISGMSKNAKRVLVGAGLVLALGYMMYLTMSVKGVSCEVCIEFHGNTECRKATGKERQDAEAAAASTACGLLAGGVGDGIACTNTTPKSVTCQDR